MEHHLRSNRFRLLAVIVVILAGIGVVAFVATRPRGTGHVVGVFLYAQHEVIQEIFDGFKSRLDAKAAELGESVQYVVRNADGDAAQTKAIASFFRSADVDVVFVVGLPAAQALKGVGTEHPVFFGGPPDPVAAGLVPRLDRHGSNFSGTKYFPSQDATVAVLRSVRPDARTVAVLHNPGEKNSQPLVKAFKAATELAGLTVRLYPVTTSPELNASLRDIATARPDGVFLPTDNFIYSSLDRILQECKEAQIDVFSCTRAAVEKGAIFAVGADYRRVGGITAEMAARVLFDHVPIRDIDVQVVNEGIVYARKGVRMTVPAGYQVVTVDD